MSEPQNPTRDFLINRRREIADEIPLLRTRIAELEKEQTEIDKFTSMFGMMVTADSKTDGTMGIAPSGSVEIHRDTSRITIKGAILDVLSREIDWISPAEIHQRIVKNIGMNVERNSVGPQLQRLKKEGKVRCEDRRYRIGGQ